ncbi:hypothetical protein ES702_03583 [subsurface metagenome]
MRPSEVKRDLVHPSIPRHDIRYYSDLHGGMQRDGSVRCPFSEEMTGSIVCLSNKINDLPILACYDNDPNKDKQQK